MAGELGDQFPALWKVWHLAHSDTPEHVPRAKGLRFWCGGRGVRGPAEAELLAWVTGGALFFLVMPGGCAALLSWVFSHETPAWLGALIGIAVAGSISAVLVGITIWVSDPGTAPRHALALSGDRDLQEALHAIMPQSVTLKLNPESSAQWGERQLTLRYCPTCMMFKGPGVSHSSATCCCIEGFDHFCGVLGQVIGGGNRRLFVWLITLGSAASIAAAVASTAVVAFALLSASEAGGQYGSLVEPRVMKWFGIALACIPLGVGLRSVFFGPARTAVNGLLSAVAAGSLSAAVCEWSPAGYAMFPYLVGLPLFIPLGIALGALAGYHWQLLAEGLTTKDKLKAAAAAAAAQPEGAGAGAGGDAVAPGGGEEEGVNVEEDSPLLGGSGDSPAFSDDEVVGHAYRKYSKLERSTALAAALGLAPPTGPGAVQLPGMPPPDPTSAAATPSATPGSGSELPPPPPSRPSPGGVCDPGICTPAARGAVVRVCRFMWCADKGASRGVAWQAPVPMGTIAALAAAIKPRLLAMSAGDMMSHMNTCSAEWRSWQEEGGVDPVPLVEALRQADVGGLAYHPCFLPRGVAGQVVHLSKPASRKGPEHGARAGAQATEPANTATMPDQAASGEEGDHAALSSSASRQRSSAAQAAAAAV